MDGSTKEVYSEVYSVLNLLGNSYIERIPKKLYEMIEREKSSTYNPKFIKEKSLSEQNIKRESLSMIALLHLNYWCDSENEKQELLKLFKDNEEKHQAEIREKYNPDNIFKQNAEITPKQEVIAEAPVNNMQLVEVKEDSWLKKVWKKIISFFSNK